MDQRRRILPAVLGTEDVRNLIRNCKQYRMTLEWLKNYNDLQAELAASKVCKTNRA